MNFQSELILHYHFITTPSHTRYNDGPHPEFDKPPKKAKDIRVPRREQPAAFAPWHVTMPVSSLSVRSKFPNVPLELPPPPSDLYFY